MTLHSETTQGAANVDVNVTQDEVKPQRGIIGKVLDTVLFRHPEEREMDMKEAHQPPPPPHPPAAAPPPPQEPQHSAASVAGDTVKQGVQAVQDAIGYTGNKAADGAGATKNAATATANTTGEYIKGAAVNAVGAVEDTAAWAKEGIQGTGGGADKAKQQGKK